MRKPYSKGKIDQWSCRPACPLPQLLRAVLSRRLGDGEILALRVVSGVKASMSTLAVRGCGMGDAGEELGAGAFGRSYG